MEGLDKDRQLQTGEIIIIVAVLLMWAGECHKQRSGRLGQRCNPGSTKSAGRAGGNVGLKQYRITGWEHPS